MDYLRAGGILLKEITGFISNLLQKTFQTIKPIADEALDRLSVKKVNLTFDVLTSEVKKQLKRPEIAKAAVCDLKKLSQLNPNVPEWANLYASGVTHMIITVGHDEKIAEAYFYQDLSIGADNQVNELINRTGEGIIVINA